MGEDAVKWSLDELLPHREPMMLLEAVETFDPEARRLTARVRVTPEQVALFGDAEGAPNWRSSTWLRHARRLPAAGIVMWPPTGRRVRAFC